MCGIWFLWHKIFNVEVFHCHWFIIKWFCWRIDILNVLSGKKKRTQNQLFDISISGTNACSIKRDHSIKQGEIIKIEMVYIALCVQEERMYQTVGTFRELYGNKSFLRIPIFSSETSCRRTSGQTTYTDIFSKLHNFIPAYHVTTTWYLEYLSFATSHATFYTLYRILIKSISLMLSFLSLLQPNHWVLDVTLSVRSYMCVTYLQYACLQYIYHGYWMPLWWIK